MSMPPADEDRLAALERQVAGLTDELATLRAELRSSSAARGRATPARRGPAPANRRQSNRRTFSAQELERLMGRYGILAIAVLAAVAAVGTFLGWAINRGYLTLSPSARVFAGIAFGALVGAWGMRLRRTERSFGSSMLGLAMVIELVCAYAAGPGFHLIPEWMALTGAALVCWSLAVFSHTETDEPLWCVAFGGAALAPFVTSNGEASVYALVGYGSVLLLTAFFAIAQRPWPVAWRVLYAVSALLVIGGAARARVGGAPEFGVAFVFPWTLLLLGVLPFAPYSRKRGALRWMASLAVLVTLADRTVARDELWLFGGLFLAATAMWLVLVDRLSHVPQSTVVRGLRAYPQFLDWIDGAVIPLMLVRQATSVLGPSVTTWTIYLASAAALGAFAWRRPVSSLRDASALACMVLLVGVIESIGVEPSLGRVAAYVALGILALSMHRERPSRSFLGASIGAALLGAGISVNALLERPLYATTPFVSKPSVAALIVAIAFAFTARFWHSLRTATRAAMGHRPEWTYAGRLRLLVRAVTVAPWIWVFTWVLIELAMAFSPSTSILLLVTYFAATAVACVAAGRARRSARLRQLGLGLAVIAAVTAVYGASTYFGIAARIAAYLVTSAFLLGIAYWYRRPGGTPAPA